MYVCMYIGMYVTMYVYMYSICRQYDCDLKIVIANHSTSN